MKRFIVSTIGTSILTNSIDRATEGDWFGILADSANLKENELSEESKRVIDTLAERAREKLNENNVQTNRRASAELNGIYGIYGGALPDNTDDLHYLICTDTAQGQKTGELIKNFLEAKSFAVEIFKPPGLSAKDTESFTAGVKSLIEWLENNMSEQRDEDYRVIFNLVGGFKALQGYMQTFGAFYADEVVYLFEKSSDLIRIPRLPIKIDTDVSQKYRKEFASMVSGKTYPRNELSGIPETLLEFLEEDNDDTDTGLSAWGRLIWSRTKEDLLKNDIHMIQNKLPKFAKAQLAMMAAGKQYPKTQLSTDIPEDLCEFVEINGVTCAKLSVWGKPVWNKAKGKLLGNENGLLPFPRLQYKNIFIDDFKNKNTDDQRCKLQETLAKVAYLLEKYNGSTEGLTGGDLQYSPYQNITDPIYHFYVDDSRRVSCEAIGGNLILRHCGAHDYVNDNP